LRFYSNAEIMDISEAAEIIILLKSVGALEED
jgi:hypothetical protein